MRNTHKTQVPIGTLAKQLGLNPKTIRYYEEIGLLPDPQRTEAGYRIYDEADLARLRFIGKAKTIGLTLQEISQILALRRDGGPPCEHVLTLLDRKLTAVDEQLRVLAEFRQDLVALREEAAQTMTAEACVCGIIEQHRSHAEETSAVGSRR
jgi:DNA-binding transcriptional MerR regulator